MKGQKVALQEPFLEALRKSQTPVSIFLKNGVRLQGQIDGFDLYVIQLRNEQQLTVFKHNISTIIPSKRVDWRSEVSSS